VIRVSGPQAIMVLRKIAGFKDSLPARKALLRKLQHPCTGEIIDKGLVIWFPGKRLRSFGVKLACLRQYNI
jgi:tRNA modification GTPase